MLIFRETVGETVSNQSHIGRRFMKELTFEEQVYYANNVLIDVCDCCGDYFPITNRNDGKDYLTITGNGYSLICNKCNK
jgi:hypothetical protein